MNQLSHTHDESEAPLPVTGRSRSRSAWSRCEEAVARVAPTSTTTCQACSSCIAHGEWQLGLMFIHVEGFMLMEWYHVRCAAEMPGAALLDVLAAVQSDMTPQQRSQFQPVYESLRHTTAVVS